MRGCVSIHRHVRSSASGWMVVSGRREYIQEPAL
jgi:hypothetical protein